MRPASEVGLRPAPPPTRSAPPAPRPPQEPASPAPTASPPPSASSPLIRLDRPFDLDEFASLLGSTTIRVTVPRENLTEVLQRVTDFMGFGIYVYAISVRPAPSELLKAYVVELTRVDYAPDRNAWVPFEEKGTSDSPFGPGAGPG